MTVLLMVFTLVLFLTTDYFVQKARAAAAMRLAETSPGRMLLIPDGTRVAENHSWFTKVKEGVTTIGFDELIGRLVGAAEEILLPEVGSRLSPAQAIATLRDGERSLEISSPVSGRVVAVNQEVMKNPALAVKDPYGSGWLVKIEPAPKSGMEKSLAGKQAMEWLLGQADLMKEFLIGCMGQRPLATLQDGGMPVDGALKRYDCSVWKKFQERFVSLNANRV